MILPFANIDHLLVMAPELAPLLRPTLAETLLQIPPLAWAATAQSASWRLKQPDGKVTRLTLSPRLSVEDMAALRLSALLGLGIALMPRIIIEEDLRAHRLVPVNLDLLPPVGRIHAVHLGKKGMRPVVRHLLDWLVVAYDGICAEER